jgi:hypothetical protein
MGLVWQGWCLFGNLLSDLLMTFWFALKAWFQHVEGWS